MEPVSSFGIAAGTFQLADLGINVVLSSIKFLQALRDTPKEVADLLHDVDKSIIRILDLKAQLQRPNEAIVQKLPAAQLRVLKETVSEGCQGIKQLHKILHDLEASPADSRRKKAWKSVVSVYAGEKIERNLKKIQRYHSEIERQLQLAGLEFLADQSQQIDNVRRAVDATRSEAKGANIGIGSLIADVQTHMAHTEDLASSLEQMKLDNGAATANILSGQSATKLAIEESSAVTTSQLSLLVTQGQALQGDFSKVQDSTMSMGGEILREFQLQRERANNTESQLKLFRDEILSFLTSQTTATISSQGQVTSSRITEKENMELNRQVSEALIRHPQALRQSCDNVARRLNTNTSWKSVFDDQYMCSCDHRRSQKWSRSKGIFGVRYQSVEMHKSYCPLYSDQTRSWEYSFSVQILPFLRKTFEFTLGATFQAGNCSIAPPLRIWNVVKRSDSRLFRLFDDFLDFLDLCRNNDATSIMSTKFVYKNGEDAVQWKRRRTIQELERLRDNLLNLASRDISPWRVRDEAGNTIMHEVINLIFALRSDIHFLSTDLEPVLQIAIKGSADMSCVADWSRRRYSVIPVGEGIHDSLNVLELTATLLCNYSDFFYGAPITQSLANLRFGDFTAGYRITLRGASYVHFFQRYPELAESLGDSIISAVAYRDTSEVRKILQNVKHGEWQCCRIPYATTFPINCSLQLAVGWPDGLRALLDAGANPLHAAELALQRSDAESLGILLSAITGDNATIELYQMTVEQAVVYGDNKIHQCILNHLEQAPHHVQMILSQRIYQWISLVFRQESTSVKVLGFLDKLYETGFERVDAYVNYGLTPLFLLTNTTLCFFPKHLTVVRWFLERGANPYFCAQAFPPNVLHSLARNFPTEEVDEWEDLLQLASRQCDLSETDCCCCPCSSRGCLPLHRLVRCEGDGGDGRLCFKGCWEAMQSMLDQRVSQWLRFCDAATAERDLYYREAVRLEVFTRLDITHTCCRSQSIRDEDTRVWYSDRAIPGLDICADIQSEESELILQLDLILEAFVQYQMYKGPTNEDNLGEWWQLLEPILPEPKPYQRCFKHVDGPRHVLITRDRRYTFSNDSDFQYVPRYIQPNIKTPEGDEQSRGSNQLNWGRDNGSSEDKTDNSELHQFQQEHQGVDPVPQEDSMNYIQDSEHIYEEFQGHTFLNVIIAHFSKVLGKGWAEEFLRRKQKLFES